MALLVDVVQQGKPDVEESLIFVWRKSHWLLSPISFAAGLFNFALVLLFAASFALCFRASAFNGGLWPGWKTRQRFLLIGLHPLVGSLFGVHLEPAKEPAKETAHHHRLCHAVARFIR